MMTGLTHRVEGKERIDIWPEHLVAGVALTERGIFGIEAPFGGKIKSSSSEML